MSRRFSFNISQLFKKTIELKAVEHSDKHKKSISTFYYSGRVTFLIFSICDYLHISRHNLKRTSNLHKSPEETTFDEFYSILQREEDIENEFIESLK